MRNNKIFNPPVQPRIYRITVVNGMGQYGICPYLLRPSNIEPKAQPEMAQLSPHLTFLKREYHRLWEDLLWYSARRTYATKACLV